MPEVQQFTFSYKEIATALIKQQGIHEGLWGLYVEFVITAGNVSTTPNSNDVLPAAIIPIQRLGLQRFDAENNLTVDAAVVNPAQGSSDEPTSREASTT